MLRTQLEQLHLSVLLNKPNMTKLLSVQLGKTLALTILRIYALLIEFMFKSLKTGNDL